MGKSCAAKRLHKSQGDWKAWTNFSYLSKQRKKAGKEAGKAARITVFVYKSSFPHLDSLSKHKVKSPIWPLLGPIRRMLLCVSPSDYIY